MLMHQEAPSKVKVRIHLLYSQASCCRHFLLAFYFVLLQISDWRRKNKKKFQFIIILIIGQHCKIFLLNWNSLNAIITFLIVIVVPQVYFLMMLLEFLAHLFTTSTKWTSVIFLLLPQYYYHSIINVFNVISTFISLSVYQLFSSQQLFKNSSDINSQQLVNEKNYAVYAHTHLVPIHARLRLQSSFFSSMKATRHFSMKAVAF